MAETLKFELVSPAKRLADAEATAVSIPALEGDMTAMPRHAPFLASLRPGVISVDAETGTERFVVTGGFVEILPDSVGVIAEDAAEADVVDSDWIAVRIEAAEKALDGMEDTDDRFQSTQQLLADLRLLPGLLNL
ncbi:MAG: ATP synthase F1 subunit epsilon [Pseudomonadota bacterium]